MLKTIAADFGISESCLTKWMKTADVEEGVKPGPTAADHAENRELKKRLRLLEQENEVNPPGESGDSSAWEGWSHVREYVEEVPGRAA